MPIKVINKSSLVAHVCINQWGNNSDTTYCPIQPAHDDVWNRTDDRGFIMGVKHGSKSQLYYVLAGDILTINRDSSITNIHDIKLEPITYPTGTD